jgi:hypothetical protein
MKMILGLMGDSGGDGVSTTWNYALPPTYTPPLGPDMASIMRHCIVLTIENVTL